DLSDPERLVQCPLVKDHRIRASRFPYHLVKCKESHPEIAKKLGTCPFNARHLVPRQDLTDHIMKCSDKALLEPDVVDRSCQPWEDKVKDGSTWQAPPCDEDWEAEVLESSNSAFVWGA
ncbi:GTSF1 factor, partial [Grallaria varia]|nr:GTSF1 factor [Grallaria varia]